MRKYDIKTYIRRWKRRISITIAAIDKGFSWKTVLLCDINLTQIPKSTKFMHPYAICINDNVYFGENCDIRHCVTIGTKYPVPHTKTIIGNNVFFGVRSTVLGDVVIGDNAIIGVQLY